MFQYRLRDDITLNVLLNTVSTEENMKHKLPTLYHLSTMDCAGKIFTPRVPKNEFVDWGVEDGVTKRIPFCVSISKALMAIGGKRVTGNVFNVYTPDMSYITESELLKHIVYPTKQQVPDVHLTHEVWVTTKVKLKFEFKIRVLQKRKEYKLEFTKKDGSIYVGHPCEWEWEKLKD